MDFVDYYAVLGVPSTAAQDDIKKSYRKLARKYHPDVSKEADADARMKAVNEAYAVLGDAEKRAAYDALSKAPHGRQDFTPPPGWQSGFGDSAGVDDPSEFFSALFGRQARPGAARGGNVRMRGQDLHATIAVSLADAYAGALRPLSVRGARIDNQGQLVPELRTLDVQIPKGVRDGQHLRLAGQGGAGSAGGAAGDLFLEVHVTPPPTMTVDGRDVYAKTRVAPWEVALGAAIEVDTPGGRVQLTVPPASQAGRTLRLKGRGIPAMSAGEPAGDLYLLLEVVVPPATNDQQRELYHNLAREMAFNPRADARA